MTESKRKGVQSIEIGHEVLAALASARGAMALGEVAKITGMSPSKTHSYLVSLVRIGMVAQDMQTGRYSLGPTTLRLGLSAIAQSDIIAASRVAMYQLVDETAGTAFLSVWGNHGPTVIARVDGRILVPLDLRVGSVLSALTSATGRTFLAFLPRAQTAAIVNAELARLETATRPARPFAFDWESIERVRTRGIARVAGMVSPGFVGIAAPVFDHEGMASAVISLLGDMSTFDAGFDGTAAKALLRVTRQLSHDQGFTAFV